MPHSATALHQLHLLLIDLEDRPVAIRGSVETDYKAIGKGGYLQIVANAGHGAALRDQVLEVVQQLYHLTLGKSVGILCFDPRYLAGNPVVHVNRRLLIEIAVRILQRVLRGPHLSCQLISTKVLQSGFVRLIVRVCFLSHELRLDL